MYKTVSTVNILSTRCFYCLNLCPSVRQKQVPRSAIVNRELTRGLLLGFDNGNRLDISSKDMAEPVRNLIVDLQHQLTEKKHSDVALSSIKGKQYEIKASEFIEIKDSESKKIAFVDGGEGQLDEAPNYLITVNRVYYSIFQGKKRIKPKTNSRIQFFSYVMPSIHTDKGKKKIRYDTRLFAHTEEDKILLPDESDLTLITESSTVLQGTRLSSVARRIAEWHFATRVVEKELNRGDILVIDGSLHTNSKNETKYADMLYESAMKKGVIVCGLAKTSRLITQAGEPLLPRIEEISGDVSFQRWYVKVAEELSLYDKGFTLAVKLHPRSKFVFRLDILRKQFLEMEPDEINSVLYSMADNAQDIGMHGYPYGAIDADRFAQIRNDEKNMYQGILLAERMQNKEWKKLKKHSESISAHDVLNQVTS